MAVILCNTGIALLAYMDGVTGTPTLGGVVLAAAAAAGFAVHKVLFRRVMGDALTFCQASPLQCWCWTNLLNFGIMYPNSWKRIDSFTS